MFDFRGWVITVVAANLLIGVVNLIAPFGKMKKMCSSVFDIFYVFLIINPLLVFLQTLL